MIDYSILELNFSFQFTIISAAFLLITVLLSVLRSIMLREKEKQEGLVVDNSLAGNIPSAIVFICIVIAFLCFLVSSFSII